MMKNFILILFTVLFVSSYALAQPECPCDNEVLDNGLTGNDILETVCPGGILGEDSKFFINNEAVLISLIDFPHYDYLADINNDGHFFCIINSDGVDPVTLEISTQDYFECRQRLIQGCSLDVSNVPTLSEWGLIATAGAIGIFGLYAVRRKKSAA